MVNILSWLFTYTRPHSPFVSHSAEKEFVFQLIERGDYIHSWIKSSDKGFYSIDYEYWEAATKG